MATADTESDIDLLALDDALTALARIDPRGAQIIELRFFSGLSLEETAEVVGVSAGTVKRDWSAARAWLYREMRQQS
jgi:RNA polymerase sigma factor (sigma-70 family)